MPNEERDISEPTHYRNSEEMNRDASEPGNPSFVQKAAERLKLGKQ
jgi:hypothetical protein